ncbi:prolipoprotein diacylglyceryl transferase [Paracoccaceae bacterium GXU_MW_L88]
MRRREAMLMAIPFPNIDPVLFSLDLGAFTFAIRWYALAYIVGLVLGWRLIIHLAGRDDLWGGRAPLTKQQADDLLTWMILGVVLGGRLGYVLFYQPGYFLANPLDALKIWQGGMSFHGGFAGVIVAVLIYARKLGENPIRIGDAVALAAPIGLFFGRLANFINAELWGRPTDAVWGVVFPNAPCGDGTHCARHPSQLYEAALEGLLLFIILAIAVWGFRSLRRPGLNIGIFLLGYGLARMFVEHFREADLQFISPDNPMGYVIRLGDLGLSMGQLLSLPMVIIGIILIARARRREAL